MRRVAISLRLASVVHGPPGGWWMTVMTCGRGRRRGQIDAPNGGSAARTEDRTLMVSLTMMMGRTAPSRGRTALLRTSAAKANVPQPSLVDC